MLSNRYSCAVGTLTLLLSLSNSARADTAAQARKAIQAQYNKESAALARKDAAAAFSVDTPDSVDIDEKGNHQNLEQQKAMAAQLLKVMNDIHGSTTILKFKLSGASATARIIQHVTFGVRNPQTGKAAKIAMTDTSEDSWVKVGGKWLRKLSRTLTGTTTMDGKPVHSLSGQ